MAFICKRLRLNYRKLSAEEKKWLKNSGEIGFAEKSKPTKGEKIKRATNQKLSGGVLNENRSRQRIPAVF